MARDISERDKRLFFRKTEKAFEQLHYDNAQHLQQIKIQKHKLEELANKKRKKIPIDANEKFVNIETIMAVQKEQERLQKLWQQRDPAKEAKETARKVEGMTIESMTVVFNAVE